MASGVFDIALFLQAAKEAGIYIIAVSLSDSEPYADTEPNFSVQDRMFSSTSLHYSRSNHYRYINAEVSGGGFPGWLQRNPATLRTNQTGFLEATYKYVYA